MGRTVPSAMSTPVPAAKQAAPWHHSAASCAARSPALSTASRPTAPSSRSPALRAAASTASRVPASRASRPTCSAASRPAAAAPPPGKGIAPIAASLPTAPQSTDPLPCFCSAMLMPPDTSAPDTDIRARLAGPPTPVNIRATPATMAAPATRYSQLSATHAPAAARPVLWESFQEASSASVSGWRPEGSLIPTGLLPA